jgi:capsular polysaccharide biosynthesis protein
VELNGFFPIIRRWLAVILAATVMATLVGLLLGAAAEKTYEARAEVLVGPLSTDTDTMRASGDLAQTYAQLAVSRSVLSAAAESLDLPTSELSSGVRATANGTTRFLVVRARSHDAQDAADIANAVTLQLLDLGKQDPARPEGQLQVIDPARPPSSPTSPRPDLIVPLAALAGLLGSLSLVLLFEFVGDTAESTEKVEALTHAPTLALSARDARSGGRASDAHRIIATQIDLAAPTVCCVLITGVSADDGTEVVARRLGDVWATRRPSVSILDARTGELTVLAHPLDHGDGLAQGVDATSLATTSPEAITVEEAELLRAHATDRGSLLLVVGAPATTSAATLVWARVADVTVLSVRRFQARRSAIAEVVANLAAVDAHPALSILHERHRSKHRPGTNVGRVDRPTAADGEVGRDPGHEGLRDPLGLRPSYPSPDLAVAGAAPRTSNGATPTAEGFHERSARSGAESPR